MRSQLTDSIQGSNEKQAWTQIFEQRNNGSITKMREGIENKLDAIVKEIKTNKSTSTFTIPRSEINQPENIQPSGSEVGMSIGVSASNNDNSDSEDEDYTLKIFQMKDLRHPAKSF